MKKLVYILSIVLLLLVFGISAFFVGSYIIESREQAQKQEEAAALKESLKATIPPTVQTPEETSAVPTFGAVEMRDENGMLVLYFLAAVPATHQV